MSKRKIVVAPLVAKAAALRVIQDILASGERPTGPQLRARVRESSEHGAMIADNKWVLGGIVNGLGKRLDDVASTPVFVTGRTPKPKSEPSPDRLAAIEQTLALVNHKLHRIAAELGITDA